MTSITHIIAQQWPRVTVGLFALWGLYGGLTALWIGFHLDDALHYYKLINPPDETEPSEGDRIVKKTFIFLGTAVILINAIKLYAPVRKSIAATRASLVFWGAEMGYLLFGFFLVLFANPGMPGNGNGGEERSPQLSTGDWIRSLKSLGLPLFNGWALFVFLRDLQYQQRDAWGRLVRTGGVLEYDLAGAVKI